MSVAEILKILAKLDVKNDEHWTENGAPRLDVVQQLYPGVTRDLLGRAAPRFCRTNPELPDLDKMRAEASARMEDAKRKVVEAKEAETTSQRELAEIEALHQQVKDSHALTRANQTWIASQNAVQLQRMERAKVIDALVADAGGQKAIGRHPVEVNTAARIKQARRESTKNFVAKG